MPSPSINIPIWMIGFGLCSLLLALTILLNTILLLNLEVIVCAVIVKNFIVAPHQQVTVLVYLGLNEIDFVPNDFKGTINIVKFIGRFLQKTTCSLVTGPLRLLSFGSQRPCLPILSMHRKYLEFVNKKMYTNAV